MHAMKMQLWIIRFPCWWATRKRRAIVADACLVLTFSFN